MRITKMSWRKEETSSEFIMLLQYREIGGYHYFVRTLLTCKTKYTFNIVVKSIKEKLLFEITFFPLQISLVTSIKNYETPPKTVIIFWMIIQLKYLQLLSINFPLSWTFSSLELLFFLIFLIGLFLINSVSFSPIPCLCNDPNCSAYIFDKFLHLFPYLLLSFIVFPLYFSNKCTWW